MLAIETIHEYNNLQHRLDLLQDRYEDALVHWQHQRASSLYSRIMEVEQRLADIETPEILWSHTSHEAI